MKLLVLCLLFGAALAQTTDFQPVEKPNEEIAELEYVDETEDTPSRWCPYGGRHYMFIPHARHWALAHAHCRNMGGTLATVHNSGMNNFLKNLAQGKPTWIGFSDAQQDRYWFWINGEKVVFANWCRGEPNNYKGPQECALINWTGNRCWDDQNCKTALPYICERK